MMILKPGSLTRAFFALSLILTLASGTALADSFNSRHQNSGLASMQTPAPTGVVVVKMAPGLAQNKGLQSQSLAQALEDLQPNTEIRPRFLGLSKSLGNADLMRYFQFEARNKDRSALLKMVARLNANPSIEVAFLEPVAVPAALGFDAFTGAVPEAGKSYGGSDPEPGLNTPDFVGDQDYLETAPLGVGALNVRAVPGALGAGVTVIDVEGGWLWSHEDLPDPVFELGVQIDDLGWRNHGTAVIGEIRGIDNGTGVSGIAPLCSVGNSSIGITSTAGALAAAVDVLQPGDVILIELHAPGPNSDGNGQFGYVPMEYWPDNFDIIRLATAKGIIVCEAAGNGYQNLDGPEYMGLFDRSLRDSGAIMCGATAGGELYSADFSNNGQRVDVNGWGWWVTTTGYGDLQNGDESEWYTAQFSGTSSASPIVTGSVTSLQGMVRESLGFDLDARMARDLLRDTGTEMVSGNLIGTRPNLEAALVLANAVVGEIVGTVTDQISGLPVAGALVQVDDQGSFTMTDDNGQWRLPLQAGVVPLTFSSYFYHSTSTSPPIIAGQTVQLNVQMTPLDLINITGQVSGENGPLSGVLVTPTDQPVSSATTDANGQFSVQNVPALYDYTLLFDSVAGYGAWVDVVSTADLTSDVQTNIELPTISEHFGFGGGGFFAASGHWTHGLPPVEVTGGAFVSSFCWGVGMDGEYGDNESDILVSPAYNLSGVQGEDYYLSFHYFSATEGGFDGVNLEVLTDSGFALLEPQEGYTDPGLGGLGGQAGWSGNSGRWHGTVFDITEYTASDFRFRLNYGSDSGVTEQGFYIDGIAFAQGQSLAPVPTDNPLPLSASLRAWPNPFNPQVNLEYSLPQAGQLSVQVYDLRGSLVRTLFNAPVQNPNGVLQWDGRQDDGRQVSSGIYLVRMIGPDGRKTSQRVVMAK